MLGADTARDTIGQTRTWILGRALAGVYFLLIGLWLMLFGLVLAAIYAVLDALYGLLLDRPLNFGRAWAYALFHHQLMVGKYSLGMSEYPGFIPSREDGKRMSM